MRVNYRPALGPVIIKGAKWKLMLTFGRTNRTLDNKLVLNGERNTISYTTAQWFRLFKALTIISLWGPLQIQCSTGKETLVGGPILYCSHSVYIDRSIYHLSGHMVIELCAGPSIILIGICPLTNTRMGHSAAGPHMPCNVLRLH